MRVRAGVLAARRARCSSCGRRGANPAAVADLAVLWLLPGPSGPVAARFCRGCAPAGGPVDEVLCVRCGDGPLLTGELTVMDLHASAAVDGWLVEQGWRRSGPVCPDCVTEAAR